MDNHKPLISVIMPVYNTQEYLREAIDSVLNQTYRNLELLLIDDGSTDQSGAICDEYALQDKRIRVFHTPNMGVSCARNLGLDRANGEWIFFIDSDDWIEANTLALMNEYAVDVDAVFGAHPFPEAKCVDRVTTYDLDQISKWDKERLFSTYTILTVWNKLLRKTCLIGHFDENMAYGEDTSFVLKQLGVWRRIVLIPEDTYYYRVRKNSLSVKISFDRVMHMNALFDQVYDYYSDCEKIIEIWSQMYVKGIRKCCLTYLTQSNHSRKKKALLLRLWFDTVDFDLSRVSTSLFTEEQNQFWDLVLHKDFEGLYDMIIQMKNQ